MHEESKVEHKRKRVRSPNAPTLALKEAIERAKLLYEQEGKNPAHHSVAVKAWNYNPKSSSALQTIGTLNSFGLIDILGKGKDREIKLSELGLDIVADEREVSKERDEAIKKAALLPNLHRLLWKKHKLALPSDDNLRHFLIRDKNFNKGTVDKFIEQYKSTISFAKLDPDDIISDGGSTEEQEETPPPPPPVDVFKVGDYVYYESDGQRQFEPARRILDIQVGPDGKNYARIEGCGAGSLPVSHLVKGNKPERVSIITGSINSQNIVELYPINILMGPGDIQTVNVPKMSSKAYEFFKKQLDLYKEAFVVDEETDSNSNQ